MRSLFLLAFLALLPLGATQPLRIAAAADLKWALTDLKVAFQKQHPEVEVQVSFGSSGNFYAQLSNRAPFDVFLSADRSYVEKLAGAGCGTPEGVFTYAVGRLVLWAPKGSPIDPTQGLPGLKDPRLKRLALANPAHAPYGRAAEAALRKAGLWEGLQGKLVLGENIAQAAQFAQSGAAEAGMLALSLALAPELQTHGRFQLIPEESHPALIQGGLVLSWAQAPSAAQAFRGFLMNSEGQAILQRWGFQKP